MRIRLQAIAACALGSALFVSQPPGAWAVGDEPVNVPQSAGTGPSAEIQSRVFYNTGVEQVRKADDFDVAATALAEGPKKAKAANEARSLYSTALGQFQHAVQADPKMYQGWNYVGYAHRKLGDYDDALEAYERALALHPGYPEAIEYRAEAYLAVNRIADAQQSYLDLFASDRAIAGKLLDAMKTWIASQRSAAAASNLPAVNDLDKWVQERAQIAAQTVSLTREGAAASWK